jgi:hypothetical protein
MNPIVVKELRQAVQSRFVVAMLMLLLAVLVVTLGLVLVNQGSGANIDSDLGSQLFMGFQAILLGTCMFFVPVYVGVRLAAERSSATADLLYVTTIRPISIIWGKLLAGAVVTALTFSACVPFMVVTYLLRGIDLPTIFFILGIDALVVLAATQLAIFVGTIPVGWPIKALLGLLLLIGLGTAFIGMTSWIGFSLLVFGIGSVIDDPDFWVGMGVSAGAWLAGVGMLFVLAVAMISPPTSNRALAPRVYFTLIWAVSLVGFVLLCRQFGDIEGIGVWLAIVLVSLVLAVIISSSEREVLGPRLRRSVPRNRLLRPIAFLMYSGSAGGLLWAGLLIVLSLLATIGIYHNAAGLEIETINYSIIDTTGPGLRDDWLSRCVSMFAWVYGYVMLAVVLCRRALRLRNGVLITGVAALLIMAVVSITPMLIAFLADPERWDFNVEFWLIANPFGPIFCDGSDWRGVYGAIAWPASLVFFGVMMVINLPWFWRQFRGFTPPQVTAEPAEPAAVSSPMAVKGGSGVG